MEPYSTTLKLLIFWKPESDINNNHIFTGNTLNDNQYYENHKHDIIQEITVIQ